MSSSGEAPNGGVVFSPLRAQLMGDRAVLIEMPDDRRGFAVGEGGSDNFDTAEVLRHRVARAIDRAVAAGRLRGVTEVVPAARTLLVCCADWDATRAVTAWVEARDGAGTSGVDDESTDAPVSHVSIDVIYDGEDLARAAALIGVSSEALVSAHTAASWRAVFGGFAPGFMYLSAPNWSYRLPRLDAPRESVPAGSVGIAGEHSAVYPAASPGGWQLIGHTDAPMWSLDRAEPALVQPGDAVQFRAVRELVQVEPGAEQTASESDAPAFTVVRSGLQTLVQDAGRPGYRAVGVTESGAMDRAALARANAAVGNAGGDAALEVVGGGLELRVEQAATVSISGSAVELEIGPLKRGSAAAESLYTKSLSPERREASEHGTAQFRVVPAATAVEVLPGQTLRMTHIGPGMRDYLAVRGGFAGERQLDSRSTDTLSGIGPSPLAVGDGLKIAAVSTETPTISATAASRSTSVWSVDPSQETAVLRVLSGPRHVWFDKAALPTLTGATWTVSAQANRIGARLTGPALRRAEGFQNMELPSEGMVRGAIQVPPGGEPVLFHADHPVTGGYPVIAVVVDDDLDRAGQLAPGDRVRFELVDPAVATVEGTWPAPERRAPYPFQVSCTLEIDGRRHAIKLPGALAAVLDNVLNDDRVFNDDGVLNEDGVLKNDSLTEPESRLTEAAYELIAGIVDAIRNSVENDRESSREISTESTSVPGPTRPPARHSHTD